jgi:hypothetical protein
LVAGKAHKATAITFSKAKEGAVKACNFLSQASITSIHTHNEKKRDAPSVTSARILAKSVFRLVH